MFLQTSGHAKKQQALASVIKRVDSTYTAGRTILRLCFSFGFGDLQGRRTSAVKIFLRGNARAVVPTYCQRMDTQQSARNTLGITHAIDYAAGYPPTLLHWRGNFPHLLLAARTARVRSDRAWSGDCFYVTVMCGDFFVAITGCVHKKKYDILGEDEMTALGIYL